MLQSYFISAAFFILTTIGQFFIFKAINKNNRQIYKELISTYQIIVILSAFFYYGDIEYRWLIYALSVLPLIYLLNSSVAFINYLGAILVWAYYSEYTATWFYLLLVFAAAYVLRIIGNSRYKISGQVIAWFIAIYLLIAITVTLKELVVSALASVVFSSYFSSLYLLDRIFYSSKSSFYHRPFSSVRTAGTIILAQVFSFDIWGNHPQITWNLFQEYIVLLILIAISFYMLRSIKKDLSALVFGGYFIFNIISYLLTYIPYSWIPIYVSLLQSIYSVLTGIALTNEAQKKHNLLLHLGGTGIILLQIVLRAAELGIIFALPSFIFASFGYIIVNYSFIKRWRKHAKSNN